MFQTFPLSIIGSFSLYIQQCYMSYRFTDSLRAGSRILLIASCQQTRMTYTYCCVYFEKFLMMEQRYCSKHVEFYSKNKFEKLVHLVGFILLIASCQQICMTYAISVCTVKNT